MINIDQLDSSREIIPEGSENSYMDYQESSENSRTVTIDNESIQDFSQEKPPARQLKTRVDLSNNRSRERKISL